MAGINFDVEFNDAVNQMNRLNAAIEGVDGGLETLVSVTNKFNAEGVQTASVIKGMSKEGKEFVATLGLMSKAEKEAAGVAEDSNELVRKSIKYTDDALKNEIKTIKEEERAWREFQKTREDAGRKYRQDQADQASFAERLRKEEEDDRKKLLAAIKKQEAEQKRAAKEEENAAKRAALELKKKEEQVGKLEAAFGRLAKSAQYFITYRAFSFITGEIEDGVKAANKLQIQLSLIRTITQDKQITFGQLSKDVRGVSDATGFDINTTAQAFYDATSNQVARGRDTAPFVRNVADLARVTGSDLPAAIDLVSTAINAYGRNVGDAELIQAQFFRTIDEGRVVASELGTGLGRVLTIAAPLGIAIEDIEATLALTTQKGLKTADAVTLLTNFLSKLEKPTVETSRFFKQLGFDSFEAAQRVLGFQKTIQLLLTSIEKGDLSTGGTFDELRSRKQLGVFQEAATGIEEFSNKLKDNQTTLLQYRKAIEIRGESPADSVNKQLNQAQNVFIENIGQKLVGGADVVLKFATSVKNAAVESKTLGEILKYAGPAAGAYAAGVGLATAGNFLFAKSAITASVALGTLAKSTVVLAALAGAYYATELLVSSVTSSINLDKFDAGSLDSMIEKAKTLKELAAVKAAQGGQGFDFEKSRDTGVTAVYKGVGGILAQAKIQNDRLVEATKGKAKETGEALKLGFAGYTNLLQDNLAKTKRAITENRNEIEKSKRSLLSFNDGLDNKLFNRQFDYANDEQKIILAEKRAEELKQKAREAFRAGTPEKSEEGRRLYDEAANEFGRAADARQQLFRKQAEASGATYFEYNTREEKAYYDELMRLRAEDEKNLQATAERKIKQDKASEVKQEDSLLRLKNALKDYQETDVFTATGGVRKEFQDNNGKFDQGKFSQSLKQKELELIKFAGNDLKLQFEVQSLIVNYRKALIEEAAAKERAEYLKTLQVQITGDEERFKKQLTAAKALRDEAIKDQTGLKGDLDAGANNLGTFGEGILKKFGFVDRNVPPPEVVNKIAELQGGIKLYKEALSNMEREATRVNGNKVYREEDIDAAKKRLSDVMGTLKQFKELAAVPKDEEVGIVGKGGVLTPSGFNDVAGQQFGGLKTAGTTIKESYEKEEKLAKDFEQRVMGPLAQLQVQFPQLKNAADLATQGIAADFANLAGPGLDPLFIRLQDLQTQMRNLAIPIVGAAGGDWEGGGGDWMAKGGVAGKFPGSPRGQDRYPIWAKKDEYIVNAESSRMFRPMLDAINSRRNPRYMASGGVVGGDTTIGDISVTVNGASTNAGTGQAVVNTLERAIRRGNLRRLRS